MGIYIYAPIIYPGTRELIAALGAKRLVKHDGMRFLHKGTPVEFSSSDSVICWGRHTPPADNATFLNANYKYTDMIHLNTLGAKHINALGYTSFGITRMPDKLYLKMLEELRQAGGKFKSPGPSNGYVPCEDFEGYGIRYYRFTKIVKVALFKDAVIDDAPAPDVKFAAKINAALGLDFGVFYFGKADAVTVLLKVITAPHLDAAGVKAYASRISKWAADRQEKDRIVEDLGKLLEG
jgi:hypothetical protein